MGNKALILLSGGLDSIALLHYILDCEDVDELHALIFTYHGQVSTEIIYAEHAAMMKNIKYTIIPLSTDIIYDGITDEYLPQRNLLFLSHALAYADRYNIPTIYVGFIDPEKTVDRYPDTTPEFVRDFNVLASHSRNKVVLVAPFIEMTKTDIAYLAKYYGISLAETQSCNDSDECGVCGNCGIRKSFEEHIFKKKLEEHWFEAGYNVSPEFKEAYMNINPKELRLLINNSCNTSCKHCFYGFKDMNERMLTLDEFKEVIFNSYAIGIRNVHFSGKEPFFDEKIFELTAYIKETFSDMTYDVVTNGINVPKYKQQIADAGFSRVCISFMGYSKDTPRRYNSSFEEAIDALNDINVPITVFYDVSASNFLDAAKDIRCLNSRFGIKDFFVRPVFYYGRAVDIKDEIITPQQLFHVYNDLRSTVLPDTEITFHIKDSYIEALLKYPDFAGFIECFCKTGDPFVENCLYIDAELFCQRYSAVTVTPDGYILGCAIDVSNPRYYEIAGGNVLRDNLGEAIKSGRAEALELIERNLRCSRDNACDICAGGCVINKFCYNR